MLGYMPGLLSDSEMKDSGGDGTEAEVAQVYRKKRKRENKGKGKTKKNKRLPSNSSFFPKLAELAKLDGIGGPVLCAVSFCCMGTLLSASSFLPTFLKTYKLVHEKHRRPTNQKSQQVGALLPQEVPTAP